MGIKKIFQYGRFCVKNVSARNTYFRFGTPSRPEQLVDTPKPIYQKMRNYMGYLMLFKFFENLL